MIPELLLLAVLWMEGGVDAGPGARQLERGGGAAVERGVEAPLPITLFRATGVRDASTAATVVHCTNLGSATRSVYVDIREYDGSLDCSLSRSVAPGETRTVSTRLTAIFLEDDWCSVPPATEQGSLLISVSAWTRLICTVQIVDPVASRPEFAERLDLFDRNGIPLSYLIFEDGFESGSTSEWSSPAV